MLGSSARRVTECPYQNENFNSFDHYHSKHRDEHKRPLGLELQAV